MTAIVLSRGDVAYRNRSEPLPIDYTLMGDRAEWRIRRKLSEGDCLTFPSHWAGVVTAEVTVGVPALALSRRWFGWSEQLPGVDFAFLVSAACPACDSVELHDAELPEVRHYIRRHVYVIRACIVCGTCWEQEAGR